MYLFDQVPRARGFQLALAMIDSVIRNLTHPLANQIIRSVEQIANHD